METLLRLWNTFDTWLENKVAPFTNRNMEPEQTIIQTPPITSEVLSTPTENRLAEFFQRIATYEGANPENNNPLDERYYFGGYLPKYGTVRESSGGFAMFETLAIGVEYGMECLRERVLNHPELDFLDFFNVFAPRKDGNNPIKYAKTVALEMGTVATANLKNTLNL